MRRPMLAAIAALSMIGGSSAALAQSSAAPLSVASHLNSGAPGDDASQIRGGFILPTLALIVIGVLIYVVAKNDSPASP